MSMLTTYDILINIHEIFGGKGRSTRQIVVKTIMNAKMLERTPIKDHIICMINLFNEMKILRVELM